MKLNFLSAAKTNMITLKDGSRHDYEFVNHVSAQIYNLSHENFPAFVSLIRWMGTNFASDTEWLISNFEDELYKRGIIDDFGQINSTFQAVLKSAIEVEGSLISAMMCIPDSYVLANPFENEEISWKYKRTISQKKLGSEEISITP